MVPENTGCLILKVRPIQYLFIMPVLWIYISVNQCYSFLLELMPYNDQFMHETAVNITKMYLLLNWFW